MQETYIINVYRKTTKCQLSITYMQTSCVSLKIEEYDFLSFTIQNYIFTFEHLTQEFVDKKGTIIGNTHCSVAYICMCTIAVQSGITFRFSNPHQCSTLKNTGVMI